jgi:hypothetical protein
MNLKVTEILIDAESINPTLNIAVDITYYNKVEIPLSISGQLKAGDNKTIATLNETRLSSNVSFDKQMTIHAYTYEQIEALKKAKQTDIYYANLSAILSPQAIAHIETVREKEQQNDVHFYFNLVLKTMHLPSEAKEFTIRVIATKAYDRCTIKQNDWLNKFAAPLGIGNFLIVEFEIPNKPNIMPIWKEFYDRLAAKIKDIENAIRQTDWQKVMEQSRRFYEILKIGDGKEGHEELNEELKKLFIKDKYSVKDYTAFVEGAWKFHEFFSAFTHETAKDGMIKPNPIAKKEDAYFAFMMATGILEVVGKKISA